MFETFVECSQSKAILEAYHQIAVSYVEGYRAKVQTCHNVPSTILYNQLTKARANEKRLTIVNPRQQCYAMSKIPSVCILESP